jgi:hypothetical protein
MNKKQQVAAVTAGLKLLKERRHKKLKKAKTNGKVKRCFPIGHNRWSCFFINKEF